MILMNLPYIRIIDVGELWTLLLWVPILTAAPASVDLGARWRPISDSLGVS